MLLLGFTLARAAYVGTIIGCLFVLLYGGKSVKIKTSIAFAFGILVIIPFVLIGLFNLKPDSALGRLTIYRISLDIIKDHPLVGVGPNRFAAVYNNYQSQYFKHHEAPLKTQLLADNTLENFNSFLQMFVEYGVIGLIIFLLLFYQLKKYQTALRVGGGKSWLYIGSFGCLISITTCSLFSNPFHVTPIVLILIYHLSNVLPNIPKQVPSLNKRTILTIVAWMAFVIPVFYYIMMHIKAESVWYNASESVKYNGFDKVKWQYNSAYSSLKYNGDFLFNYGAEASLAGNNKLAIKLLERAKRYNSSSNLFIYLGDAYLNEGYVTLAEQNYLHAIFIAPSRIYPKYQLIQLYKKWPKPELVKYWTLRTLKYPVKVSSSLSDALLSDLRESIDKVQ